MFSSYYDSLVVARQGLTAGLLSGRLGHLICKTVFFSQRRGPTVAATGIVMSSPAIAGARTALFTSDLVFLWLKYRICLIPTRVHKMVPSLNHISLLLFLRTLYVVCLSIKSTGVREHQS